MPTMYVFDVDGTLTPSRQKMDAKFQEFFLAFAECNSTALVTGSDYPKTVEQVGEEICHTVGRVFNCLGNDMWYHGKNLYTNPWTLPDDLHFFLLEKLFESKYKVRTGNHIEQRPGLVNFSVVGRNADIDQRKDYFQFDQETKEREQVAMQINLLFPDLEASVGGETGIDIHPKGLDKQQVLKYINSNWRVAFFGDKTEPGGNDYSIARAIREKGEYFGEVYTVRDWRHTFALLSNIFEFQGDSDDWYK